MVLLRNGKATPTPMPGLELGGEEEMVSIPGHHSLLEINQKYALKREMEALGLTREGQLTRQAIELATPALPDHNPFNYFDVPLRPDRCQEILWKGAPKQCGGRPSRGGDRCWRHNVATRTGRTAVRQDIIRENLNRRREEQHQRRANERQKLIENKRLRQPIDIGDQPPILDLEQQDVEAILDVDWDADRRADQMKTTLDRTEHLDINLRRPLHHPGIPLYIDAQEQVLDDLVGQRQDDDRLFELATMTVRGEPRAVFAKCMLCRVYHYPVQTSLVPERWSIKCCTCEARVHRHCQETVPLFYFDHLYQCPACLAEN